MSRFLRFCAFLSVLFFSSNAMAAYTCTVSYTSCNNGYYLSGTSCLECPDGFVCSGGTAKPYKTFYFNLNGGTGTTPSAKTCYYNQSCSLDAGTGTSWYRGGQVFKGWSNVSSGALSTNIYTTLTADQVNSSNTPFKHGTTYYAQWTPCSAGTYKLGYGVAPATACSSCSSVGDGTYKSSATGANSQNQCYKTSTNTGTCVSSAIPANCSSATCSCSYTDYYGTTETCTLNNVTSVTANTNAYKASTTTCSACPSSHPYSSGGNINSSSCYKTCTAYDSGGYRYTPNATTVYYNNSCTYSSACITSCTSVKNTAVVASGTQSCTRSGCSVTNGSCYYSGATQTYTDTCTGYYTSTGCSSAGATCSGCSTSSRSLGTCSGGTRVITCPAGSYWDGSKCNTSCGNGYYCPGFSNVAETSLSSGHGRNACTNTKPSNSVYSGTATSNACPWSCNAGYYGSSANGNTTCAACGNGYFCTGGANRQSCASTVPSSAPTPSDIISLSNGSWSDYEHAVKASDCICNWYSSDTTRTQYLQQTTCSNGPSGVTYTAYSWCRTGYYAADPLNYNNWYSSCKACTNKPSNATYTSYSTPSSMYAVEDNCPWQCNANYYKSGNSCVSCTSVSYTDSGSDTEDIKIGGVKVGSRTRTKSRTCYRSTSNAGSTSSSACSGTSSCGSWNYSAWSVTCNAGYHKSGDTCAEDVCYVQYYCNQEDESASESLDFSGTTEAYGVGSAGCSEPTGQHFTSWYEFDPNSEDNSGVTYEEGEEITCPDDGTSYYLAPMYSKNTYTIKYNANGGTGTMADTTATYDVNVTLRSNTFARTGYTFAGWATSATGNVAYSNGQEVKNLANSGTVTLYAKWTANTYTITLNDNNGSGGSGIVKEVYNTKWTDSGGTTVTSVTVPSRSGYTFKGYYTATSGGTQHITAAGALPANTTFTSNTTLYAQWTANQCTINYSCNGSTSMGQSSGTGDTQTITVSGTILYFDDIPCPAPTGYNTGDDDWELYIDDDLEDDYYGGNTFTCTTNGEEIDLRAYYVRNRFSISYAANGGTGSAPTSPTSCQYDRTCTAPSNTYTRTGYTFAGWKCTGGTTACDGDIIAAGGSLKNVSTGSAITLTAQWTANKYSCDAGYYLSGTSCQKCTADYYCPGGEWTYNGGTQGRNSCSTATNNGYPYSEAGSDAITDCYSDTKQRGWTGRQVSCTKPANAYSVQCNSCSIASCAYVAYSNESGTGDGAVKSGCEVNVSPCTQTVASVTCNAGARRSSTTTCELCGTGTYMDSEGHTNTSCKSASPGHYVNTTGATKQTPCANWTYQPDTGKSSCIACPTVESGYSKANSTGTGWTSYESCVEVATSSPSYCTAGKLQKIPKSSGSTQWATATVNTALQAKSGYYVYGTSCVPCSGGNYCTGGTAQPQKCVAGSYSNGASATCTACPAGTTTSSAGATGASSCTACSNASNVSSWATPSWNSNNTMTNLCYATGCKYGAYYSASNNEQPCTLCSTVSNNTTTTTKISGGTRREVCAGYYISGAGGTKDESMCTGCSYVKSTTVMCDSGFELENGQCINRNMCIVERTYSTCESGYYMTYDGVYDGTPKAGNACTSCPTEYGYSCAGGQARPVKTLTFNLNGGAGTAPATITCNYGESCTLDDGSGTTWYRAGYKFVGWSTNKNATSGSTSASNFVHGNTLYAIWSACTNGTYKAAGVAAKNACSACQDLTAPAKTGGTYSTSPESAATAATACRYVGQDIETPANCHNVTKNTVAFNGSWGSGLYTVTAKKGSRVVTATGVAPTCTQCSGATYQSTDGYTGTSCTACDSNYQANTDDGKTSASQCQVKCSAGYAVVKENQACATIQNSTYKGKYTAEHYVAYGSTSTISTCPQSYQDGNGTTAQNQCINSCVAGTMVASANADCTTPNNTTYGSSWYTGSHNVTYGNTSKGLSLVSSCPTTSYTTPNTTTVDDHNAKSDCTTTCDAGYAVVTADANCADIKTSTYKGKYTAQHTVSAGTTSNIPSCPTYYQDSSVGVAGESNCINSCSAGTQVASANADCTTPNNTTYGSSWYTAAHNVTYGNTSKGLSLVSSCPTANYATPNTTTVSDHNAKADCSITCEAGTVVATEDANCSTPDGSWYSDRHAVAAGSTSGASKVACDSDYANSGTTAAAHAGEASCKVTCPAGKWVAAEYEACVDLTSGYYTTASQTVSQGDVGTRNECEALNAFYTASDNGRDAATDCYGETTITNWVKTPKSGLVTCDEDGWCPGGKKVYYNETGGRTACTANSSSAAGSDEITDCSCDAGYSGNAAVVEGTCSACDKGTYKSSAGNTTCTNAGIGYYVDIEGATTRKACTDFRANTSTTGTQSTASSACVCVAGHYLNGSNVCDVCAEGSYKSDLGNNACKAADKNYYVDGTGKTEQIACTDLGSFYTTTESTASTSDMCYGTTTAGKYIKTKNSSTQETCPAKSFCPTTNVYYGGYDTTGGREPCPAGYQDGTTGYSEESQCLMNVEGGKYVAEEKESVASGTCGLGYAKVAHTVPYGETSSCEPCTGATYADATGQTTCTACPTSTQSDIIEYSYWISNGIHTSRDNCYVTFGETTMDDGAMGWYGCYVDSDADSYGVTGNMNFGGCWVKRAQLTCDGGYYNKKLTDKPEQTEYYAPGRSVNSLKDTACEAVGAGYWSPAGDITRNDCPGGYVHGSATAASENQCAINVNGGHYIGAIGQNSDNWGTCVKGYAKVAHTVPYGETSSCEPCTEATYADETGLATCKSCPTSTQSDITGYGYYNGGKTGDHTDRKGCHAAFTKQTLEHGTLSGFHCYVDSDANSYGITGNTTSPYGCIVTRNGLACDAGYYNAKFDTNETLTQYNSVTTAESTLANACVPVESGYWSQAGDITRTECLNGWLTIGYGSGADEEGDCGRVLHAGANEIYLRSSKKTTTALHVKVGDKTFYGNMCPAATNNGPLKVNYNSQDWSVMGGTDCQ